MTSAHCEEARLQAGLSIVAEYYGVSVDDIRGVRRFDDIVVPRQVLMWVLRECGASYSRIALLVRRDHATVMYGVAAIQQRMGVDRYIRVDASRILAKVRGFEPGAGGDMKLRRLLAFW